jgi:hypothetical protein
MALIVHRSLTVTFRNILCPLSRAGELTPGPEEESAVGRTATFAPVIPAKAGIRL